MRTSQTSINIFNRLIQSKLRFSTNYVVLNRRFSKNDEKSGMSNVPFPPLAGFISRRSGVLLKTTHIKTTQFVNHRRSRISSGVQKASETLWYLHQRLRKTSGYRLRRLSASLSLPNANLRNKIDHLAHLRNQDRKQKKIFLRTIQLL